MARRRLLKDDADIEISPLADIAPMSGFFTYGEFFTQKKKKAKDFLLFNETMTAIGLSESKKKASSKKIKKLQKVDKHQNNLLFAMVYMTNIMAKEWSKLNQNLQRDIEQKIDESKEKDDLLYQQSKLAQMGEMIGMIAHQWRQPLNAISSAAINLSVKSELDRCDKKTINDQSDFIQQQAQKMSKTIDDFIQFVKPKKMEEDFNVKNSVENVLSIIRQQLNNRTISIEVSNLTKENIVVKGYKSLLEQVIMNLLVNSRDAFDDIGDIEKKIKVIIWKDQKNTYIEVEDNAGGVKKA